MIQVSLIYMELKEYNKKEKEARLKQRAYMSDCLYMDRKNIQELCKQDSEIKKVREEQAALLDQLKFTHHNDEIVDK